LVGETPPITNPAKFAFSFWDRTPGYEVGYSPTHKRWRYPRRGNPTRHVEFIGVTQFAPRVERRDRLHAFRASIRVVETAPVDPLLIQSTARILDIPYSDAKLHTVEMGSKRWKEKMPQVTRGTCTYSELHMGAGEQKVVNLVQFVEALPRQSLILLEEPELMLHPNAQRGLAWYLMTVSRRKGHQILLATHSSEVFESFPEEARVLLLRSQERIDVLHRAPQLKAARALGGMALSNKEIILVEDEVARRFLELVLRRHDRALFDGATIVPVGSGPEVGRLNKSLSGRGVRVVSVRDADQGSDPDNGLFSLPGNSCPESLLLGAENILRADRIEAGLRDAWRRAGSRGIGYAGSQRDKRILKGLAEEMNMDEEVIADRLTLAWLEQHDVEARNLVKAIATALESRGQRE
jgi:hypothetical protein